MNKFPIIIRTDVIDNATCTLDYEDVEDVMIEIDTIFDGFGIDYTGKIEKKTKRRERE